MSRTLVVARNNTRGFVLLLAVTLASSACADDPYPFQEIAVSGASRVDPRFGGAWYDSEGTVLLEVLARRGQPRLRLRLPPGRTLLRAEYGAVGLVFEVHGPDGSQEAALRPKESDQDVAWIGSADPSARPTGCGWEYVTRRLALEERAEIWLTKAGNTCRDTHDGVMSWLGERL
jgi:hypothetical protein